MKKIMLYGSSLLYWLRCHLWQITMLVGILFTLCGWVMAFATKELTQQLWIMVVGLGMVLAGTYIK